MLFEKDDVALVVETKVGARQVGEAKECERQQGFVEEEQHGLSPFHHSRPRPGRKP